MPTFTPPTVNDLPPFDADSEENDTAGYALMKFFKPRLRGVDVFILSDGTFAQDVPTAENNYCVIPAWPLMPDQELPNIISRSFGIPGTADYFVTTEVNPYVIGIYWGGHAIPITAAEALALTDYTAHGVGYGANITEP